MRAKITKRAVDAMQAGDVLSDTEIAGFRARRQAADITYELRYRNAAGKRVYYRIGRHGEITPEQARRIAKQRVGEVASGSDPAADRKDQRAAAANTVTAVLANFVWRYVRKSRLRSGRTIVRTFRRLVRPHIGSLSIYELKRLDVVTMLDAIEDSSGPTMADRTLAYLRKAFRWQAARDDRFTPPIVPGMARTKPKERSRKRILDDQEIRDVWRALDRLDLGREAPDSYPRFIRALLLTGQRRTSMSHAHRDEVSGTRWVIPGTKMKGGLDHLVPLSAATARLFGNRGGHLFASDDDGRKPFSGYSKAKAALDRRIRELRKEDGRKPMPHWVLHDLRRTARSIMSRFTAQGVSPDIAERVLGHVIPGVRGVYDVYEYADEKKHALELLAQYIEQVVAGKSNVVALPQRRKSPQAARASSARSV